MRVADAMTHEVRTIAPGTTLAEAAKVMQELDVGAVPVCEGRKLVGILTDRDVVVRGLANDVDPQTCLVDKIMTPGVSCCYEDESLDEAAEKMGTLQVRRMPVLDRAKNLVGILSLGDVATREPDSEDVARAIEEISQPSKPAL